MSLPCHQVLWPKNKQLNGRTGRKRVSRTLFYVITGAKSSIRNPLPVPPGSPARTSGPKPKMPVPPPRTRCANRSGCLCPEASFLVFPVFVVTGINCDCHPEGANAAIIPDHVILRGGLCPEGSLLHFCRSLLLLLRSRADAFVRHHHIVITSRSHRAVLRAMAASGGSAVLIKAISFE